VVPHGVQPGLILSFFFLFERRLQKVAQDSDKLKERFNQLKRKGEEKVLSQERNELLDLRNRASVWED